MKSGFSDTPASVFAAVLLALGMHGASAQIVDKDWSEPFLLSNPEAKVERGVLAVDTQGRVHSAWVERFNSNAVFVIQYAVFDGHTWSSPVELHRNADLAKIGSFDITVDSLDNVYVAWTEAVTESVVGYKPIDAPAYFMTASAASSLDASKWSSPRLIPVKALFQYFRVAGDGTLHIVYTNLYSAQSGVYHSSSADGGTTWSEPIRVHSSVPAGYKAAQNQFEIDGNGGLHVAWEYKDENTWISTAIAYARSTDGGKTWSETTMLDQAGSNPYLVQFGTPNLAVHGSKVSVVWSGGGFANVGRRFRESSDGGVTWGAVEQLFGDLHGWVDAWGLRYDADGVLHFLDLLRWPQGIWSATRTLDGWQTPDLVYLQLQDGNDTVGERLTSAEITLAAAKNQLVATFIDDRPPNENLYVIHTLPRHFYFPFLGNGKTALSGIAVGNTLSSTISVLLSPRNSDGTQYSTQQGDTTLTVPPQGTVVQNTSFDGGATASGFVALEVNAPKSTLVAGVLSANGVADSLIAPMQAGRSFSLLFAQDTNLQVRLNALRFSSAPLAIQLYDESGWLVDEKSWDWTGQQDSVLLGDLFGRPQPFKGYARIQSAGDFVVCGFEITDTTATFVPPVALTDYPGGGTYYQPLFADGNGLSTTIAPMNLTDDSASVLAQFFDLSGQPETLVFAPGTAAETTINMNSRGSLFLTTLGTADPPQAGFMKFTFGHAGAGLVLMQTNGTPTLAEVLKTPANRQALTLRTTTTTTTVVSLLPLTNTQVNYTLYDSSGAVFGSGSIAASKQLVTLDAEKDLALPAGFVGTAIFDATENFVLGAYASSASGITAIPVTALRTASVTTATSSASN